MTGWTSWNQDRWEKQQQSQLFGYHSNALMAEREEELKNLLMRVKEKSEKIQLKTKY